MSKDEFDMVAIMERFGDEDKARELFEKIRWPNGPVCPFCGSIEAYRLNPKQKDSKRAPRKGLLKCKACRKQFTVTVGTIFEGSHIPLNRWLMAIYLICSSKKGMSAHQLHRMMGITYKSAWFMAHRIRYAMTQEPLASKLTDIVEADETYVGGRVRGGKVGRGSPKIKVFSLIQRKGESRSFVVDDVKGQTLKRIIKSNVADTAYIMTDEFKAYNGLKRHYCVNHSRKEYVRGIIHTNFAESFFSLLKRGIIGNFHHISERHTQRYLDEFDYRWSRLKMTDGERMVVAIKSAEGKRLTYRTPITRNKKVDNPASVV